MRNSSYLLNNLSNFNSIFRKDDNNFDNIKSDKEPSLEDYRNISSAPLYLFH